MKTMQEVMETRKSSGVFEVTDPKEMEQIKEMKAKANIFRLNAVADYIRSQIQFISKDLKRIQQIKRFDEEYKADRQSLKDRRKQLTDYLNDINTLIQKNENPNFDPQARLHEIIDQKLIDVKSKYFSQVDKEDQDQLILEEA